MRTYDIPYVKNPLKGNFPNPPLDSLDLRTLVRNYLCGKAEGKVSSCTKCTNRCIYGQRAIDLMSGKVFMSDYIEPQNQTEEKKQAIENSKQNATVKIAKDGRKFIKNWYKLAMDSDNAVKWVMDNFEISDKEAKKKIEKERWRVNKKKNNETIVKIVNKEEILKSKEQKPEQTIAPAEASSSDSILMQAVESKLDALMKLQDEYQRKIDEYKKLYEGVKQQIDILCSAVDIINGKK